MFRWVVGCAMTHGDRWLVVHWCSGRYMVLTCSLWAVSTLDHDLRWVI